MKKNNYVLIKKSNNNEIVYIDYDKLDGYKLTPKNRVKYDGVVVNQLILIKPSFIEKILIKKTRRKLEEYLQYIINMIDNDDSEDGDRIDHVLDEVERYRRTVKNNYRVYLDQKYYHLLLKKIDLIEQELAKKAFVINHKINKQEEIKEKRGRSR